MEKHLHIDLEFLASTLKGKLDRKDIESVLTDLIKEHNEKNSIYIKEEIIKEELNKLYDENKIELSDFDKLIKKAVNYNPKKSK